jgi:hypothetical protein
MSEVLAKIGVVCLVIVVGTAVITLGLLLTALSVALTIAPFILAYQILVWAFLT